MQPRRLASGGSHSCAITASKNVRCWGKGSGGQLGGGTTSEGASGVVQTLDVSDAIHIAAGYEHSCVIVRDGTVRCWGVNTNGRLGDGTRIPRSAPVAVSTVTNAVALALGSDHTCALLADKTVSCWGGNGSGQLGDGSKEDRLTPVKVMGLTGVKTLAAGDSFTCATTEAKKVHCWGENGSGQVGVPASPEPVPLPTLLTMSDAEAVTAAGTHACASFGKTASCWGSNLYGELGDGNADTTHLPVQVKFPGDVVEIAAGSVHTCGVSGNGQIKCWGENPDGRFGNGTEDSNPEPRLADNTSVSTDATTRLPTPTALAVGGGHVCALVSTQVYCWGNDMFGQSGEGAPGHILFAQPVKGAL